MWQHKETTAMKRDDVEGAERWEFLTSSGLAGPLTQLKVTHMVPLYWCHLCLLKA